MDAEDGGTPGQAHRQVTRACYPAVGIELELGEVPVLQCSRWEPDNEQSRLDTLRADFLKKPEGKAFAAKVEAFEQAEAALADAVDDEDSDHIRAEVAGVLEDVRDIIDDAIGGAP
jgi:hypothetical protein